MPNSEPKEQLDSEEVTQRSTVIQQVSSSSKITKESSEPQFTADKIQKWMTVFTALFGIITAVVAIYTNIRVTETNSQVNTNKSKIDELTTKFSQSQTISEAIDKALPNLAGKEPVKARITLARLYTLVANGDDKDKYILINIALASDEDSLVQTIIDLIQSEDIGFLDKNPFVKDKVETKLKSIVEKRSQATSTIVESADSSSTDSASRLLEKLTTSQTEGWIFLGWKTGENKLENRTIEPETIPRQQQLVKITGSVNIRFSKPEDGYSIKNLGKITGALSAGNIVEIRGEPQELTSNTGKQTVWAKIILKEKNQPNLGTKPSN